MKKRKMPPSKRRPQPKASGKGTIRIFKLRLSRAHLAFVAGIVALAGVYMIAKSLAADPAVRFILFCPSDQCRGDVNALNGDAKFIQNWYKGKVGKTFRLKSTVIIRGSKPASYYLTCNQSGGCGSLGGIGNVYNNLYYNRAVNSTVNASGYKNVVLLGFYTGSKSACGVGKGGLAVMDAWRGSSKCNNIRTTLAHELGHTWLGTGHTCDGRLMNGYVSGSKCTSGEAVKPCAGKDLNSCSLASSHAQSLFNNTWFNTSSTTKTWHFCAWEGQTCYSEWKTNIRYGADGRYNYGTVNPGSVGCNNATFGDPYYGYRKHCDLYY